MAKIAAEVLNDSRVILPTQLTSGESLSFLCWTCRVLLTDNVDVTDQEDWPRLARFISERMDRRGWTQADVDERGGPSPTKLRDLLKGRSKVMKSSTRRALEAALDWEPMSIDRVLAGGTPVERLTRDDLQRSAGPVSAEDEERSRFIEEAFAESERRSASAKAAADTSRLGRLLEARGTRPEDRTSYQWDIIYAAEARRDRDAAAAKRLLEEEPLVELVDDGQALAAAKDDEDVSAYVRQVEAYAVSLIGVERLTSALDWRTQERTTAKAVKAGILDKFLEEIDRLRSAGVDGRDLLQRMTVFVDTEAAATRHGRKASAHRRMDMSFDPAAGTGAALHGLKSGLREMADRVESDRKKDPSDRQFGEEAAERRLLEEALLGHYVDMYLRALDQQGRTVLVEQARHVLDDLDPNLLIPAEIADDLYARYIAARHSANQGGDPKLHAATELTNAQREAANARYVRERSEMILFDGRIRTAGAAADHIAKVLQRVAPPGYIPGKSEQGEPGGDENQDDGSGGHA